MARDPIFGQELEGQVDESLLAPPTAVPSPPSPLPSPTPAVPETPPVPETPEAAPASPNQPPPFVPLGTRIKNVLDDLDTYVDEGLDNLAREYGALVFTVPGLQHLAVNRAVEVGLEDPDGWKETITNIPEVIGQRFKQFSGGMMQAFGSAEMFKNAPPQAERIFNTVHEFNEFLKLLGAPNLEDLQKSGPMGEVAALALARMPSDTLLALGEDISGEARQRLGELQEGQNFWQTAVTTAAGSLGDWVPAAAVAGLTRSWHVLPASFGIMEYGRAFDEGKAGGLDNAGANRLAVLSGAFEYAGEFLPAKAFAKVIRSDAGKPLLNALKRFFFLELMGENATETAQLFNDFAFGLGEDVTVEGFFKTLGALPELWAQTTASTIISGGVQSGIGAGTNRGIAYFKRLKDHMEGRDASLYDRRVLKMIERGEFLGPYLPPAAREALKLKTAIEKISEAQVAQEEEIVTLSPKAVELFKDDVSSLQILENMQDNRTSNYSEDTERRLIQAFPKLQTAAPGQVELESTNYWKQQIAALDEAIRKETDFVNMEKLQERRLRAVRAAQVEDSVLGYSQSLLQDLVQNFAPNMKVVLTDPNWWQYTSNTPKDRSVGGSFGRLSNGTSAIVINAARLLDGKGSLDTGFLKEVVLHEFGHVVVNDMLARLPSTIRTQIRNDYVRAVNKIAEEDNYRAYLKQRDTFFASAYDGLLSRIRGQKGPTISELAKKHFANIESAAVSDLLDKFPGASSEQIQRSVQRTLDSKIAYIFGMNEWIANQSAKVLAGRPFGNKKTRAFFSRVTNFLKKLYSQRREQYGISEGVENFFTYLQNESLYQKAWQTALQTPEGVDAMQVSMQKAVESILHGVVSGPVNFGKGAPPKTFNALPPEYKPDDLSGDLDRYTKTIKWGASLLQLADLNPHIKGLQDFTATAQTWWQEKMNWVLRADERLQEWKNLGGWKGQRAERLGQMMFDITVESFNKNRRLTEDEIVELAKKHNVNDLQLLQLYKKIENDFQSVLSELEDVLVQNTRRALRDSPEEMELEIRDIRSDFAKMRERNFFPLARFGSLFVREKTLKDQVIDGVSYKAGQTTAFLTFESERQMKAYIRKNKRPSIKMESGELTDTQKLFAGVPPQLLKHLKKRMQLTPEQQAELDSFINETAPGQSFRKHFLQRKNTPGYSEDAMRAYANYFLHFGNYVARIKYQYNFLDAINEVRDSAEEVRRKSGSAVKRDRIVQHLSDHYDYLMDPGNELANLRALGFIFHLGFMVKSAVVNLTQVELVTYPHLAAIYGDAKAVKAIGKAMKDAGNYWRKPQRLTQGQHAMLEYLKNVGILSESAATELAAVSEGSLLQRLLPGGFLGSEQAGRIIRNVSQKAAWMFQMAETFNRYTTALAAYDLEMKQSGDHEKAVQAALRAVRMTQYEYARWNRPKLLQRKRGVFFLFWQYRLSTLYFIGQDKGSSRYLLMLFLFAGLSGLPFAEDIMDLYDFFVRKLGALWGNPNLDSDIRRDARAFTAELGANPDLIMHGLGRYSFGLDKVGDFIGLPIPATDMSGSISMGRLVPGIEPLFGREGDFNDRFTRATEQAAGPVASVPLSLIQAIADDNPNTLKRFERSFPNVLKSLSKAARYTMDGVERLPNDAELARFDLSNPKHIMEIIGQSAGFAPTRVNVLKEKYYATQDLVKHWELRRRYIMMLLDKVRLNNDAKAEMEVWEHIRKFNAAVPYPQMKLGPKDFKRSLQSRARNRILIEQGQFAGPKGATLQADIDLAYPVPEDEDIP